jgi:hypothetical protein
VGKLKLGMPFPIIRQRWPDPLFPLLQQMQELNNLDQDIINLRAGWMEQIAQGGCTGRAQSPGTGITRFDQTSEYSHHLICDYSGCCALVGYQCDLFPASDRSKTLSVKSPFGTRLDLVFVCNSSVGGAFTWVPSCNA